LLALPSLTPADRGTAMAGAAVMRYAQGDLDAARHAAEGALAVSKDGSMAAALAKNILGHVGIAAGDLPMARDYFKAVVDRFGALGVPWFTGNALAGLASVSLAGGDLEETDRLLADARAVMSGGRPGFFVNVVLLAAVLSRS